MHGKPAAVLDASLIFTLSSAGLLERILASSRYEWHLTPLVRGEILRRETRNAIDRALAGGQLRAVEIDISDAVQLDAWADWELLVDAGEAEAIVLALARDWVVGLEDRYAQRVLDRRVGSGHWINATNLLLDAIRDEVMTLSDANAMFITLDSYPGYRKRSMAKLTDLRMPLPALLSLSEQAGERRL